MPTGLRTNIGIVVDDVERKAKLEGSLFVLTLLIVALAFKKVDHVLFIRPKIALTFSKLMDALIDHALFVKALSLTNS